MQTDAISRNALIREISQKIKEVEDPFPDKFDLGCRAGLSVAKKYVEEAPAINEPLGAAPPKWISVEERLPEHAELALVYAIPYVNGISRSGSVYIALFIPPNKSWREVPSGLKVTHWMQFPKLPKEENK